MSTGEPFMLEVRGTICVFPGDQDPSTETGLTPEYERQLRDLFDDWFVDLKISVIPQGHSYHESIESLQLHRRVLNPLRRYGISTMRELLMYTDAELLDIPSFGVTCLRELHEAVAKWRATNEDQILIQ